MSNTKRDWGQALHDYHAPQEVLDAWDDLSSHGGFIAICDWAVSVRDRELAGEVEKMAQKHGGKRSMRGNSESGAAIWGFVDDLLALLSPQNEKDQ